VRRIAFFLIPTMVDHRPAFRRAAHHAGALHRAAPRGKVVAWCRPGARDQPPHGARGGGPTGARNGVYRHGLHTAGAVAERGAVAELVRQARADPARPNFRTCLENMIPQQRVSGPADV